MSLFQDNSIPTRKYDYRAFGEQLTQYEAPGTGEGSGYPENPFGFTGREIEHGTDLYHYRARSYDPMVGRFMSADPYTSMVMMGQGLSNASTGGFNPLMMGMGSCGAGCGMSGFTSNSGHGISRELAGLLTRPLSMNDFGYVMGNPLIYKDPWGLDAFIANDGYFVGHTIFGITNESGVQVYHFFAKDYYNKQGQGKIPVTTYLKSIFGDEGFLFSESFSSMSEFENVFMSGEMPYKITNYASGTIYQDQTMIARLRERLKKQPYSYSILRRIQCVSMSESFFSEYLNIGWPSDLLGDLSEVMIVPPDL